MSKSTAFVDNYLPALLGQAWYLLSNEFRPVVEGHGLSVLEWRVLSALTSSRVMTVSQLAEMTVSKQPTVTRLLHRLEAQGHVVRSSSLDDRRCTLVKVTPSGRRVVTGLIKLAEDHQKEILNTLSPEKVEVLMNSLKDLVRLHRTAE